MPHIEPLEFEDAAPAERATLEEIARRFGRATNMKRTMARSQPALHALLEWYPLHDAVQPFLGERLTALFCHAISARAGCLLCSTYFRRALIEAGETPESPALDDREQSVVEFGRRLAADANGVDDALFARLSAHFSGEQIVALTAFGGLMIATNVFNSALGVDLDDDLEPYRLGAEGAAHG